MESQQKKKTGKGSPSGKVWLAGAGPGDASLLTLKVKKWMDEADVIIYDALISAEILSLIRMEKNGFTWETFRTSLCPSGRDQSDFAS